MRYELGLGSFEIRFQSGMSSLDDHIRRVSSAFVCILEIFQTIACQCNIHNDFTLQELCCGFLLSREMWYCKSVFPSVGAGCSEKKKNDEKMLKILFVLFYLETPLGLESEVRLIKCLDISSL